MLGKEVLSRLQLQRQLLVLESDLNRLALLAECERLQAATAWVGAVTRAGRSFGPWLTLAAPVAGFLFSRGLGGTGNLGRNALRALKLAPALYSVWRRFRGSPRGQ